MYLWYHLLDNYHNKFVNDTSGTFTIKLVIAVINFVSKQSVSSPFSKKKTLKLITNIRIGQKRLPEKNTLDHYKQQAVTERLAKVKHSSLLNHQTRQEQPGKTFQLITNIRKGLKGHTKENLGVITNNRLCRKPCQRKTLQHITNIRLDRRGLPRKSLQLITNIRLCQKGLPCKNTLAFYKHQTMSARPAAEKHLNLLQILYEIGRAYQGKTLQLITNIQLGRKGLPEKYTLAY